MTLDEVIFILSCVSDKVDWWILHDLQAGKLLLTEAVHNRVMVILYHSNEHDESMNHGFTCLSSKTMTTYLVHIPQRWEWGPFNNVIYWFIDIVESNRMPRFLTQSERQTRGSSLTLRGLMIGDAWYIEYMTWKVVLLLFAFRKLIINQWPISYIID